MNAFYAMNSTISFVSERAKMAAAAGHIAKENEYLRKFKDAGAVSPETAVRAREVGADEDHTLRDLIKYGLLKKLKTTATM